ncbi:MAG TPA: inositol monophosphatase, partial [Anaerolineae bacterium]|nr:inositol monophosphatase [Anaerolineae bacterium]
DADTAAQQMIVDLIRSHDPQAAILAEEGLAPPPGATALWVVDPLDGTTNYARRFPVFSVSIAYVEQGRPQVGIVYDPLHELAFSAERDRGAWLNSDRLQAAATADIASAVVALDWGRGEQQRAQTLDWLAHTGRECRTTRALGSAALGLSYLAAGWIDVYFHPMLAPWDGAAGQVIAEEAGALLFNFAGARWNYTEPDCIACTPQLADWARRSIY